MATSLKIKFTLFSWFLHYISYSAFVVFPLSSPFLHRDHFLFFVIIIILILIEIQIQIQIQIISSKSHPFKSLSYYKINYPYYLVISVVSPHGFTYSHPRKKSKRRALIKPSFAGRFRFLLPAEPRNHGTFACRMGAASPKLHQEFHGTSHNSWKRKVRREKVAGFASGHLEDIHLY
jgi:hypothetical protein